MTQPDDIYTRETYQKVAVERLADAHALFQAGQYSGSYYIGGYAIECALKACIAKLTNAGDFPPKANLVRDNYYTHDLKKLLICAKLDGLLANYAKVNQEFGDKWSEVVRWTENRRYQMTPVTVQEADNFLQAIDNSGNGVVQWLQVHW